MSFIQYKLTKSYSNVIYEKKRNMDKIIKFPSILLFVFLFSMTEEFTSNPPFIYTKTPLKCRYHRNCPQSVMYPKTRLVIFTCQDGYCIKATMNPEYSPYGG
jgi:hypothetical protein